MLGAEQSTHSPVAWRAKPSPATLAFLGVIVLGGLNAVAVRIADAELAPFWGATARFGIAAAVLLVVAAVTRTSLPRGRALTGSVLYGVVGFAGAFGCIHWALVQVPPASAQTVLALVPLLTLLVAVGMGLERFRWVNLIGALVAFCGIGVIFAERLGAETPIPSLAAIVAGAVCMAGSNIIVKRHPTCQPVAYNAVAMATGAVVLLAVSIATGEAHALPQDARTWAAVAYVALAGSVAVFSLFVFLMQRWTASRASTVMLLMPLVTLAAASVVFGQAITPAFVVGGALVLAGVTAGVPALSRTRVRLPAPATTASAQPGCA